MSNVIGRAGDARSDAKHAPSGRHACSQDAPECRAECCGLECLVHPRFYCGQLLTDQDLGALVDWLKAKTGLSRYRNGWGVVCGLDVRCDGSADGPAVVVTPGYAVTCCGDDVVLCEQGRLDLGPYCPPPAVVCERLATGDDTDAGRVTIGGVTVPLAEVVALDVFVQYRQRLAEPQVALARHGCDTREACEYGRVEETYELCARPVARGTSVDVAGGWQATYGETMQRLLGLLAGDRSKPGELARGLKAWLDEHPPRQFCAIEEAVCRPSLPAPPDPDRPGADDGPDAEQTAYETAVSTWLETTWFWLVQDWRNAYFRTSCHECSNDYGVPLARAVLRRPADGRSCSVLLVEPYSPHRRPLRVDGLPTPSGHLNLAPLVWSTTEDACVALADLGLRVGKVHAFSVADDAWRLKNLPLVDLTTGQQADGRHVELYEVADACGARRVVTICASVHPDELVLTEVAGIGDAREEQLKQRGIEDVSDLANADAKTIAAALSMGEGPAVAMIEGARGRVADLRGRFPDYDPLRVR
jgi:hypothetical protein